MKRLLCIVAMLTCLPYIGCGGPLYDYTREPDPRKREFVLGVGDGIHVNVWKNSELSVDARVRPDGTITMPLLGDIRVAGRTPSWLRAEITRRLQNYIRDEGAVVSVAVTEVNSYHFTVSGNVEHGGLFNAKSYVTVSEAIAMAGGVNRFSNNSLVLVRTDERGLRRVPFDYRRIASGMHPEEDIVLVSGDTLFAE